MLTISPTLRPILRDFVLQLKSYAIRLYEMPFSLSYRELEEMMMIRGARIDHSTLQRWVKRIVLLLIKEFDDVRK